MHGRLLRAGRRRHTADHVDLVAHDGSHRRATLGRKGRQRLPVIGGGIVFPCIVDGHPRRRTRGRQHEAAERIDLAAIFGKCNVMRQHGHRFFLRPLVGGRIVLVDHSDRLPARSETAKDIHLAVRRYAQKLLCRLRKRCELGPFALPLRRRRQKQREPQRNETTAKRTDGANHVLLLALTKSVPLTGTGAQA